MLSSAFHDRLPLQSLSFIIDFFKFVYGNTAQFPPCGLSTAPAAAALRIVRYCLIFTAGHRIVPCRFYMYPIVYHVLHDKSIFHRQIRNFYTCPGKFCWNGARAFFGGCFPLPGCKFNQRIKANPAKQKVPSPQRYCRSGTSSYIRMLICLRCGRRDFGGLPLH